MHSPRVTRASSLALLTTTLVIGLLNDVVSTRQIIESPVTFRGLLPVARFDVSPTLADMAETPTTMVPRMARENPDDPTGGEGPLGQQDLDAVVQDSVGDGDMPATRNSFDTVSNTSFVSPPDPVGDVGPNHYVVMSNLSYAVYAKDGTLLAGPSANNTLWSGFGGACQNENAGDPIVVYDQYSDRWMLTQFTGAGPTYFLCVALSTGPNPAGTYYRWAFSTGPNFPDYPKFGVWPTAASSAYFASTREFNGGAFAGVGAYAFNRAQMIAGVASPTVISFLVAPGGTPYSIGDGLLPADADGAATPPNGPGYFLGSQDTGGPYAAPSDALNLWKFVPNFTTPASSTFTLASTIAVAAFDSMFPCAPTARDCIGQPGTTQRIDHQGYRQRLLHRAAYRNFGTHESIVLNQSVEASPDVSGVRWYEVRNPNAAPTIFQQGTFAPGDGVQRWFGSIAMDQRGNMGLGYSVSNATSIFPGIRYTGRRVGDALGVMAQGERVIMDGTGSQTGSARWGDYTSMNVDPVDDCTFWYINQYIPTTSANGWRLRVGSFRYPDCGPTPTPFTRVDNNTAVAINDLAASESAVNVKGLAGAIKNVRVSFYIAHTFTADLDISLIGPDGTTVDLTSDNGGGGNDFGSGCAPEATRTSFDDAAATSITAGVAPFHGSFRPEQALSAFNGKSGTAANGQWRLRVTDDLGGDVGTLQCWSLYIDSGLDNNTVIPINDLSTIESPLVVAGATGAVKNVRVSMHATHTFAADLDISLIAPDGTIVELSTDNGGTGDNFGSSCTPQTARATFDDSAANSIANEQSASAPFSGSYRPEQPLSRFRGKAANGQWRLRVTDDLGGDVGTLQCWSLIIETVESPLDFDADGDPELLWQHPDGRAVAWIMDGTTYGGDARYLYGSSTEWKIVGSADFSLDGRQDLVWQDPTGRVVIWVMNGTTYSGDARSLYASNTDWRVAGAADFNGDAKPDLVWQHPQGQVVVWIMDGTTYTGDARTLYGSNTEWRVIGAADLTGDGNADLLWQHPLGNAVAWVMNSVTYSGDARALYSSNTEWVLKGAADYSRDGKPDLVWQHPQGQVVIWIMDGTVYGGDARALYGSQTEWRVVPR